MFSMHGSEEAQSKGCMRDVFGHHHMPWDTQAECTKPEDCEGPPRLPYFQIWTGGCPFRRVYDQRQETDKGIVRGHDWPGMSGPEVNIST